jgi:hypothetical protein
MLKFCEGFIIELCAVREVEYNHIPVLGSEICVSDISKYVVLCEVRTVCPIPWVQPGYN